MYQASKILPYFLVPEWGSPTHTAVKTHQGLSIYHWNRQIISQIPSTWIKPQACKQDKISQTNNYTQQVSATQTGKNKQQNNKFAFLHNTQPENIETHDIGTNTTSLTTYAPDTKETTLSIQLMENYSSLLQREVQ